MNNSNYLVGDIGGTNARFAMAQFNPVNYSQEMILQCNEHATVIDAIENYLSITKQQKPQRICLAVAGPVVAQQTQFTNNGWNISSELLVSEFSLQSALLLNDFEAIAYSIPHLSSDEIIRIGKPLSLTRNTLESTIGVIGAGTGLGAVGLTTCGDNIKTITSEAGHAGFSPESSLQMEILKCLQKRFERVSIERILSGPGIENLFQALCEIHEHQAHSFTAAEIFDAAIKNKHVQAKLTIDIFFEILGQAAGDFALNIGAWDGMYIAGGIAQRYPELLTNSRFRTGFESKGRHKTVMTDIPTSLITHQQPGLLGAASAFVKFDII